MKKCEVCEQCDSKYRCPTCRILYCSVGCYKTHKDNCKEIKPQDRVQEPQLHTKNEMLKFSDDLEPGELTNSESDDEDKVTQEQLSALENSQSIKDMLQNKHLRRIIREIDGSENPENELESAMKLTNFVEFANECMKIVEEEN